MPSAPIARESWQGEQKNVVDVAPVVTISWVHVRGRPCRGCHSIFPVTSNSCGPASQFAARGHRTRNGNAPTDVSKKIAGYTGYRRLHMISRTAYAHLRAIRERPAAPRRQTASEVSATGFNLDHRAVERQHESSRRSHVKKTRISRALDARKKAVPAKPARIGHVEHRMRGVGSPFIAT